MSLFAEFVTPARRQREEEDDDDDSDADLSANWDGSQRSSASKRPRLDNTSSNGAEDERELSQSAAEDDETDRAAGGSSEVRICQSS